MSYLFVKEMLKIVFSAGYLYGWAVGFSQGTIGIYHTPTDEEIESQKKATAILNDFVKYVDGQSTKYGKTEEQI